MSSSFPQTVELEPQINGSRSDEAMPVADSSQSLVEFGNQHLETVMEIRNGGGSSVADNEAEEQQETQRELLGKAIKLSCGLSLSLSVPIFLNAVMANINKSGKSSAEIILFKASATFSLLSFMVGVALFISLKNNNVGRSTQLGLIIIAIVSLLASVVILAVNIVF